MNVLIIGSGGREHAIAWKCKQSSIVRNICALPGNTGIYETGVQCVFGNVLDLGTIRETIRKHHIDLVFIAPEAPLVAGISDALSRDGIMVFGPSAHAAKLEGSKVFTKELLKKHSIPSAEFEAHSDEKKALAYGDYLAQKYGYPVVIKADGLAAGKGVIIAQNRIDMETALHDIMVKKVFGIAGENVVIEQFLDGEEASIQLVVSGKHYCIMPASQDHKRALDGDKGPNTGGMGAYAPCPLVDDSLFEIIEKTIIKPLMNAFERENLEYKGVLYMGLMITKGKPFVLEFNVRFGDPETQVVLPLIKNDLCDIAIQTIEGKLDGYEIEKKEQYAACVTCASKGYPGSYEKGKIISINALKRDDIVIFHAGTTLHRENGIEQLVTSGGRVLSVVGLGDSLAASIDRAYEGVKNISFDGMWFRKDIGWRAYAIKN